MNSDSTTKQFKKQLPRNLIMKGISFGSSVLIGLWLVPYLIEHLGVAAYGMVPLAAVFTQYVSIIAHALTTPVLRFLTVEMKKDGGDSVRVFTTALCLFALIAILQIPLVGYGILNIDVFFSVPAGLLKDAQILFACSGAAYLLTFTGAVFGISFYSKNRLDIQEGLRTTQLMLRFGLIVSMFALYSPALRYIGYADLAVALYLFCSRVFFWRLLSPELRIRLRSIDVERLIPILRMSFWVLINYLGVILFLRTNLWVANKFISEASGGEYGALLMVDSLIRSGTAVVSFVLSPMIMIYFSKGELSRANRVAQMGEKIMMGLFAILCALLCAFSPRLLDIWLGEEFVYLWPVLVAMISHLFLNAGCSSLFHLHNAYNKVKIPAIVTVLLGLLNVLLGVCLTQVLDLGLFALVLMTGILLTLKNIFIIPAYTSFITKESLGYYLKPILSGFIVFLIVTLVSMITYLRFIAGSLPLELLVAGVAGAVGFLAFLRVCVTTEEYDLLLEMCPGVLKGAIRRIRSFTEC